MAYVADMVMTGKRLQDVEEVFTSLVEETNKIRLEINEKKTKFMRRPYSENEYVTIGTYNF
jgi:hypothetical protein